MAAPAARTTSYGQSNGPTWVDRFGVWLSLRRVRKVAGAPSGKRVADLGCGYEARMGRELIAAGAQITLVDVAVAGDLKNAPETDVFEGQMPEVLSRIPDASQEAVICNSVLEHLDRRQEMLNEIHRILAPGGTAFINVPSWRGKAFLEFSAFRLGLSPAEEMEDHKIYYDPRDLWPLLVAAGFKPSAIECRTHKFGLNTYALCRKVGP